MKTPMLLEVQKDSPSTKEKVEVFKKLFGVETHNCGHEIESFKWMACHRPCALAIGREYGVLETDSMFEIYSKICRLIDECGADAYGATERDAIRNLCDKRDMPCWL